MKDWFDLILFFYVRMRNGLAQMIINVEAKKDEPGSYQILNRAIFYVSRLISSQKERDFVKSNYNDIKTVYSIWGLHEYAGKQYVSYLFNKRRFTRKA